MPSKRTKSMIVTALAVSALVPCTSELYQVSSAADLGYPNAGAKPYNAAVYEYWVDENGDGRQQITPKDNDNDELMSSRGYYYRNCTDFVAWKLQATNGYQSVGGLGYAAQWGDSARARGIAVDMSPAPGAVAWWGANAGMSAWGHVAWVESVSGSNVTILQYNAAGKGEASQQTIAANKVSGYIHFKDLVAPRPTPPPATPSTGVAQYKNTIVKMAGDDRTSWFVTPDLKRLWIPDGGTYNQLVGRGFPVRTGLSSATLNRLPDQSNWWVASGDVFTENRSLRRDMSVRSSDRRYNFVLQGDGNLVLYGPSGRAIWSTDVRAAGWRDQVKVRFSKARGTLQTYASDGRRIWESGGAGLGGDRFVVQSDGNLVIYAGSRAVWASNTAGRT